MTYLTLKAKLGIPADKIRKPMWPKCADAPKQDYTNFSGNYDWSYPLTKERYERAMRLSRKMRDVKRKMKDMKDW